MLAKTGPKLETASNRGRVGGQVGPQIVKRPRPVFVKAGPKFEALRKVGLCMKSVPGYGNGTNVGMCCTAGGLSMLMNSAHFPTSGFGLKDYPEGPSGIVLETTRYTNGCTIIDRDRSESSAERPPHSIDSDHSERTWEC